MIGPTSNGCNQSRNHANVQAMDPSHWGGKLPFVVSSLSATDLGIVFRHRLTARAGPSTIDWYHWCSRRLRECQQRWKEPMGDSVQTDRRGAFQRHPCQE